MNRLTKYIDGEARQNHDNDTPGHIVGDWECMNRLAAYEDTGLTPEEVKEMRDACACKNDMFIAYHVDWGYGRFRSGKSSKGARLIFLGSDVYAEPGGHTDFETDDPSKWTPMFAVDLDVPESADAWSDVFAQFAAMMREKPDGGETQ